MAIVSTVDIRQPQSALTLRKVYDKDQMASDFVSFGRFLSMVEYSCICFMENLVKLFPDLATCPLHLMGESYAGMYIPYITKAYFEMEKPPVYLARIAMGDGSIASGETFELLSVVNVLET
ncbi:hypothetical protein J3R83DRAFT_5925 [Lanmaoa asiatica]|nr:hypothetical protein J3R83DRAFT_5925 [Lanmaoa asiatica]